MDRNKSAAAFGCRKTGGALALAMVLSLGTGAATAWGPVGHRAVGAVADELLSARAQAAVADLLAQDLDREGRLSGRRTLAEVADWADEIRGGPGDRPRWHYDNRPVCATSAKEPQWCARGECATAAMEEMLSVLADRHRTRAERNEALKWAVHLAADLHQPLHAADLAEGGNRIRLATGSKGHAGEPASGSGIDSQARDSARGPRDHGQEGTVSLHAFWDSRLVALALHPEEGAISAATLARLTREARAQTPARVAEPAAQWAAESNELARRFALKINGVGCDSGRDRSDIAIVHLPRGYVARATRIVEERLALAGARLAWVLNQTLGEGR